LKKHALWAATGVADVLWFTTPLFLSFLLIYFFDVAPAKELFILPEWSVISLGVLFVINQKQKELIPKMDFSEERDNLLTNSYTFLVCLSVVFFILSFIGSRNYQGGFSEAQLGAISLANPFILCSCCALYFSTNYRFWKYRAIKNITSQ